MCASPSRSDFCIPVDVVRVLKQNQLVSVVMMRLGFAIIILSSLSSGLLVHVDGPLSGLVQPFKELLRGLGSFHLDSVVGCIKGGLASLHTKGQEKWSVLN